MPPELTDYQSEIASIARKELGKLASYSHALSNMRQRLADDYIDSLLVRRALAATKDAMEQLEELVDLSLQSDESTAFNELIKYAGFAFRSSISARTLFLRHTPTLIGFPHALDPSQNHRLNKINHIVDYARNAYHQFQDSSSGSPRILNDNPVLKSTAASLTETLYAEPQRIRSVLFSSAIGAIDSLIDYIMMSTRGQNKKVSIGKRCWFEIIQYAHERYPDDFNLIDETNTSDIVDAIRNPLISGLIVEPLGNHPETTVMDIERVMYAIRSTHFPQPKIIVFDMVHIPDVDIFHKYLNDYAPHNLCLALVTSGVKYMQAGWDISKSGLIALRYDAGEFTHDGQQIDEKLIDIRSVSGRAPSIEEALLADIETSASFRSRIRRYDSNMQYFAMSLDVWLRARGLGYISSAWLPTHPRHRMSLAAYGTGGRIMFIYFNKEHVSESRLGELCKNLSENAEKHGASLMMVPSFGMAAPHIHIVIRPGLATTLRISSGSTNRETVERLLKSIYEHLEIYIS
jgi:hypothetical protein